MRILFLKVAMKKTEDLNSNMNPTLALESLFKDNPQKMNEENLEKVWQLIEQGADLAKHYGVNTPLLHAIILKSPELASKIINKDNVSEFIDTKDTYLHVASNTPLILAIKTGYYDLANELLDKGANPNIPSGDKGFTPLHWAMACIGTTGSDSERNALLKLVRNLIDKGAEPTAKNFFNSTPLDILNRSFDFDYYQKTITPFLGVSLGYDANMVSVYEQNLESYENGQDVPADYRDIHQDYQTYDMIRQLANSSDDAEFYKALDLLDNEHQKFKDHYEGKNTKIIHFSERDPLSISAEDLEVVRGAKNLKTGLEISYALFEIGVTFADMDHAGFNDSGCIFSGMTWHRPDSFKNDFTSKRDEHFKSHVGREDKKQIMNLLNSKHKQVE